jgi:hypothetical protein
MEKARVHLLPCVWKGITYNKTEGIKDVVNYCCTFQAESTQSTGFEKVLRGKQNQEMQDSTVDLFPGYRLCGLTVILQKHAFHFTKSIEV